MNDEELLAVVRAAYAAYDPVPAEVLDAADAALRWRAGGAALARLTADDDRQAAGLRGAGPRLLTFAGAELTVQIEVSGAGRSRTVAGQLVPPSPARVHLRHPEGELVTTADDAGQFALTGVPAGPVSLLVRRPEAGSVVTSWIRL